MPILSFLRKLRRQSRRSPDVPDRRLEAEARAAGFLDGEAAAGKKMITIASPESSVGYAKAKAPSHAARRTLNSAFAPNMSRKHSIRYSTRKNAHKSRRPFVNVRALADLAVAALDTDLSLLPALLNDSQCSSKCSTVTLHGVITDHVLAALARSIGTLRQIVFDESHLKVEPSHFSSLMCSLRVEALSFFGCRFEDAQLIDDGFFAVNTQITALTVSTKDGSFQSFPLLTDRTLIRWAERKKQPPCLQLYNVSTSFTIIGVEQLIRAYILKASPFDRLCCKFGRLNTSMEAVVNRLARITMLKLHCVHDTFLVALACNPRAELTIQTTPTAAAAPVVRHALQRHTAIRRRPSAAAAAAAASPITPESAMLSKSSASRATLTRNMRRSLRALKTQQQSKKTCRTLIVL